MKINTNVLYSRTPGILKDIHLNTNYGSSIIFRTFFQDGIDRVDREVYDKYKAVNLFTKNNLKLTLFINIFDQLCYNMVDEGNHNQGKYYLRIRSGIKEILKELCLK